MSRTFFPRHTNMITPWICSTSASWPKPLRFICGLSSHLCFTRAKKVWEALQWKEGASASGAQAMSAELREPRGTRSPFGSELQSKGEPRSEPPAPRARRSPAAGLRLAYLLLHFPGTFPFPSRRRGAVPAGGAGGPGRARLGSARLGPAPPAAARAPLHAEHSPAALP